MVNSDLASEWRVLQVQFDDYEKYSLLIKLVNVLFSGFAVAQEMDFWLWLFFTALIWFTDAIWKTFQSRIETRLLDLEGSIASVHNAGEQASPLVAYQFNQQFQAQRPSMIGLVLEYAKQALRPTVAFPHLVLLSLIPFIFYL